MPTFFKRTGRAAVQHATSPLTIRAVLLFLMFGFFAYVILSYAQERQAAADRAARFDMLVAKWTETMAVAQQNAVEIDYLKRSTSVELDLLNQMSKNMADMSQILSAERDIRSKEHGAILNAAKRPVVVPQPRASARPTPAPCWRVVTSTEKFGDQTVVKRDLIRTKCPK